MEKINTELFLREWVKIESKLNEISNIPKRYGNGESFEGYNIDDDSIYYNSYTHHSGCDRDECQFEVKFSELNNPISYFEDKYKSEIDEAEQNKVLIQKEKQEVEDKKELEQYNKLKEKYGQG